MEYLTDVRGFSMEIIKKQKIGLSKRYYKKLGSTVNKDRQRKIWRDYSRKHKEERKLYTLGVKVEVMTHYGKDGRAQCRWDGCEVQDIDMLTIDHVNNDGYKDGDGKSGFNLHLRLRRTGYPEGYQTLCANHQLKK